MKRRLWIARVTGAALISVLPHFVRLFRREAQYLRSLHSYSDKLKPGMTRSEVETYLRSQNVEFSRMCCVAVKRGAFDDLVQVGHEKAGWICIERFIYVAFQFSAVEPNEKWIADSDRLVDKSLFRSDCLDLP